MIVSPPLILKINKEKYMFDSVKKFMFEDGKKPEPTVETVVAPVTTAPVFSASGNADPDIAAKVLNIVRSKVAQNLYFKLTDSMQTMMAAKLDECSAAKGSAALLGINVLTMTDAVDEVIVAIGG